MLLKYGVGEDSREFLGHQGDQTVNPKGNPPWIFIGRNQLNGHGFDQILRDSKCQGSLACSNSWGHKELDTTEPLNNNR